MAAGNVDLEALFGADDERALTTVLGLTGVGCWSAEDTSCVASAATADGYLSLSQLSAGTPARSRSGMSRVSANVIHQAAIRVAPDSAGQPVQPQLAIAAQVPNVSAEEQGGGVCDQAPVAAPPE